jgi:hypothetical protein
MSDDKIVSFTDLLTFSFCELVCTIQSDKNILQPSLRFYFRKNIRLDFLELNPKRNSKLC